MRSVLLLASLAGCVPGPTGEQMARADFGSYPTDYESIVKNYYALLLKDPYSVVYAGVSEPKQFYLGDRLSGGRFGYLTCATLNAKNSFGAYIGYQTDALLIRDGAVVAYVPKGDWWGRNVCQIAAQAPTPPAAKATADSYDEAWAACFRRSNGEAGLKTCMQLKGFEIR